VPQSYYFHIRQQETSVLLRPACDDLDSVERRLSHYADHIRLSDEDAVRMRKAASAVAEALATIRRLRAGEQED
jgi:hypothetical protein